MDEKGKLFKESLKNIQLPFRLSGLPLHSSEQFTYKLRFIFYCHFFVIFTVVSGALHFVCIGVAHGEDFTKITFMAPCICFSVLANVKAFSLILNRRKICELIDGLVILEENTKKYIVDDDFDKERIFLHKVIRYFNVVYVSVLIGFSLSPFSTMALKYYNGNFELHYPLTISYPFDHYHVELYLPVYLHQVESNFVVFVFISAADYFFYTCCVYISCQFKLLNIQFENFIPVISHRIIAFEDMKDKFVELVEWQQKIISLSNTLEAVYTKSTLYNFVTSSVLICLTLFDVTAVKDLSFAMTFLFFMALCLLQIALLCYFGDKVTQASTKVGGAVYNSLWYNCDTSVGKHLLLVLIRSQKPCKLTALGFADVNQRAFMKILRTAWSYFALLKTIYD